MLVPAMGADIIAIGYRSSTEETLAAKSRIDY